MVLLLIDESAEASELVEITHEHLNDDTVAGIQIEKSEPHSLCNITQRHLQGLTIRGIYSTIS